MHSTREQYKEFPKETVARAIDTFGKKKKQKKQKNFRMRRSRNADKDVAKISVQIA